MPPQSVLTIHPQYSLHYDPGLHPVTSISKVNAAKIPAVVYNDLRADESQHRKFDVMDVMEDQQPILTRALANL